MLALQLQQGLNSHISSKILTVLVMLRSDTILKYKTSQLTFSSNDIKQLKQE